jgi:hypothetical protein
MSCLVECGLLWQLANLSSPPGAILPMIGLFFLGEVATSILMIKFFFIIPIVVHTTTALCLTLAFWALSRGSQPSPKRKGEE